MTAIWRLLKNGEIRAIYQNVEMPALESPPLRDGAIRTRSAHLRDFIARHIIFNLCDPDR